MGKRRGDAGEVCKRVVPRRNSTHGRTVPHTPLGNVGGFEMNYSIKMSVEDTKAACRNYIKHRRHAANKRRIDEIKRLTAPVTKSFFGIKIRFSPKCESSRDAIRYLKSTPTESIFYTTLWDGFGLTGKFFEDTVRSLLARLESNCVTQDVELCDSMAFLAKWVNV